MNVPVYPFAAMAGQPNLKLVLLLASVDWRLSVLLKGDKGSGKSTAARALAGILPAEASFVNLPIGTTEDRLLGGLDLGRALQGQAQLKRGLIHEAHGGVLYVDEINLLTDSLTDALLDVASSGHHYVERDGFSDSTESQFILLGSMNMEEGGLRPQLLDRFALSIDVEAPLLAADRAAIVQSRLRFDSDPTAFSAACDEEQRRLQNQIVDARTLSSGVHYSEDAVIAISAAVADSGVRSLRADLAVLRAAVAHAALEKRMEVSMEDIHAVLPFALHHRTRRGPSHPPAPQQPKTGPGEREQDAATRAGALERIFPVEPRQAPEIRAKIDSRTRGRSAAVSPEFEEKKLDLTGSLTRSFGETGTASLKESHLVFKTHQPHSGYRFILVVDASGSHAAQQRMRAVKGVASALLESSVDNKDEVALVCFRGAKAEVILEPCRDAEAATRALEFLPTGGRTPLAHALQVAASLVTASSLVVLITDGRANVPLETGDPWVDALESAKMLSCPAVLVDSSLDGAGAGLVKTLASAMRARVIPLDGLSEQALISVLRQ